MSEKRKRIHQKPALAYLTYRVPMPIAELYIHRNGYGYYLCPRCRIALEREFSAYCDRCGQCLNWTQYKTAKRIYLSGKE